MSSHDRFRLRTYYKKNRYKKTDTAGKLENLEKVGLFLIDRRDRLNKQIQGVNIKCYIKNCIGKNIPFKKKHFRPIVILFRKVYFRILKFLIVAI